MDQSSNAEGNQGCSWLSDEFVRLQGDDAETGDRVLEVVGTMPASRHPRELLEWAERTGCRVPLPGAGETAARWETLATVAARDLVAARVLEPHLDAIAILGESAQPLDVDLSGATWGVWAAEGPAGRLRATTSGSLWTLDGVKPWCSLAGHVTGALVTAWVDDETRALFAVDTRHSGFSADDHAWVPSGLAEVSTSTVTMSHVPAQPIADAGWYLNRPGFSWGGIGVAAVWFGGAVAVARRLAQQALRREPDDVALMHLGEVDARLMTAQTMLAHAAASVDSGRAEGAAGAHLASQVRQVVAGVAEDVLIRAGHSLGPGPLSQEHDHVRRVADLALYLRQHHAERDAVALGRMLLRTRIR